MVDYGTSKAYNTFLPLQTRKYMKKFFTSLLALVGMVAGLTLSSCGGGGGSSDTNPSMEGLVITLSGSTPNFSLTFVERRGMTDNYECLIGLGGAVTEGSFAMQPGFPQVDPNTGAVVFQGNLGFDDGQWLMTKADAASFFGVPSNGSNGCSIIELTVRMELFEKKGGNLKMTGKGYGYDNVKNPSPKPEDLIGEDEELNNIDKTYSGGLSVEGSLQRFID